MLIPRPRDSTTGKKKIKNKQMKINLQKENNSSTKFIAKNSKGHSVAMENSSMENPTAASPMELVLMAIAGCSSIDIVHILEKQKLEIEHLEVNVNGTRREEIPRYFTSIDLEVIIDGEIPASKALRALDLSFGTYCSVSKMLEKSTKITYSLVLNGEKVEK